MEERVKKVFADLSGFVEKVDRSVFGMPGYDPEKDIPKEIRYEDWKNPSIGSLGDGTWLVSDPTAGLSDAMDAFYGRMIRALIVPLFLELRPHALSNAG